MASAGVVLPSYLVGSQRLFYMASIGVLIEILDNSGSFSFSHDGHAV